MFEGELRQAGCYLKRERTPHSLWVQLVTGAYETIPRHQEIKELLAQKILKNLSA
ncbi:MAG: addiction module toxin, HicA family [Deltaproteobacteria bacterium]|nr:addiction module toxin, HicA family [Deltaproteobacteria bacterium]